MRAALSVPVLLLLGCGDPSQPGAKPDDDTVADTVGDTPVGGGGTDTPLTDETGGPGTPERLYRSGSRISRRMLHGDDGSQQFIGFIDQQTGAPCGYQDDGTGTWRCLPTQIAYFDPGYSVRYADARCRTALVSVDRVACGTTVPTALRSAASCGEPATWYAVGAEYVGTTYTLLDGVCSEDWVNDTVRYYRVGAELPITTFVAATEVVE